MLPKKILYISVLALVFSIFFRVFNIQNMCFNVFNKQNTRTSLKKTNRTGEPEAFPGHLNKSFLVSISKYNKQI